MHSLPPGLALQYANMVADERRREAARHSLAKRARPTRRAPVRGIRTRLLAVSNAGSRGARLPATLTLLAATLNAFVVVVVLTTAAR